MSEFPHFYVFFLLAGLVGAAPLLWKRARFRWNSRRATSWQPATAKVQITEVENVGRSTGISVTIRYSYFAQEYYSGEHVISFDTEDMAYDFARLIRNSEIPARFDLQKPSRSVLDEKALLQIFALAKEAELREDVSEPGNLQFETAVYTEKSPDSPLH